MTDIAHFVDPSLYPDLIEHGSLIAAITSTAQREGLDPGRVFSEYTAGEGLLTTAMIDTGLGRVSVLLGARVRSFALDVYERGFAQVEGATDDLTALVRAAVAWRIGTPLAEFAAVFPFAPPTRLAWAYASGDPIGAQWEWLRSAEDSAPECRLVDAAFADARLRAFFPYLSHGTLSLTSEHGSRVARTVTLAPVSGGGYKVAVNDAAGSPRDVDSLNEAVAAAAGLLARA